MKKAKEPTKNAVRIRSRRKNKKEKKCLVCGEPAEIHHNTYESEDDIAFLCREHHGLWHKVLSSQDRNKEIIGELVEDLEMFPNIKEYIKGTIRWVLLNK